MNKIHRKKLNTKMSYNMFFLHSLNYIHIFIFFYSAPPFYLFLFAVNCLFEKICTQSHTITHSFIHPLTHSLARSLTTHHCLNMVFAVVVVLVVVCFFHLPEKKKFIRNEHSQNKREKKKKKSNCKCIRGFDMN